MFCKKCGSKIIDEDEKVCPYCGEPLESTGESGEDIVSKRLAKLEEQSKQRNAYGDIPAFTEIKEEKPEDPGSAWYVFLGFMLPIVGVILFFVWKNEKAKSARQCGIGALISIFLSIIFLFPVVCCVISVMSSTGI